MDYIKNDPSATDFSFVLALLRTGHTEQQIEQRIIMERPDFRNHQGEQRKQQGFHPPEIRIHTGFAVE
jgi:hypothetical protein